MWHSYDGMGWWMVFGMIWMAIFWGGIVWLLIWGVGRWSGGQRDADGPIEIARKRYARGEITREQFEQLQHDLT